MVIDLGASTFGLEKAGEVPKGPSYVSGEFPESIPDVETLLVKAPVHSPNRSEMDWYSV
jgi:hypothetical protein